MPTTVHVVDDDTSFRTTIARLLRMSGYEVEMYESAQLLLEHLPVDSGPSCILLDVKIPGVSGPELQERLTALGSALPIIFLTGYGDIPTSVRAIKAGADDFLTKPVRKNKLLEAIERAIARSQAAQKGLDRSKTLRSLVAKLTPRERQVFEGVARGKSNKQIARELESTERTIKAHRHRAMQKVHAESLAELVLIAERVGLLVEQPSTTDDAPEQ